MEGEAFLSDLLDVGQFENGVMNIVCVPCGSGKTTCAINRIAPLASSPRKALYIKQTQFAAGHTTAAMTLKHYVKNRQHRPNTALPIAVAYGLKTDN